MHKNNHDQWVRDIEDYSAGERQNFRPYVDPDAPPTTTVTAAPVASTAPTATVSGRRSNFKATRNRRSA